MKKTARYSLRSKFSAALLICWLAPILLIVSLAGFLMNTNFKRSSMQALVSSVDSSMEQVEIRMSKAFESSKAVSYDGVVRSAWRKYQDNGSSADLYSSVSEYLNQSFSRDSAFKAVFVSFPENESVKPYATSQGTSGYAMIRKYQSDTEKQLLQYMSAVNSGIFLLEYEGELYMARNLLDSHFVPYATVVMLCDTQELFQSVLPVASDGDYCMVVDGRLEVLPDGSVETLEEDFTAPHCDVEKRISVDSHQVVLYANAYTINLWRDIPELKLAVVLVFLLAVPMLLVMILLFYRNVTHPMDVLAEASTKIREGERGYVIQEPPRSTEFEEVYSHFNAMSTELKNQFERSYQEQQALQQAKIKALQSQINPHFLNNTLEIINWEARIADNQRVSAMIEALSTMLDAALDRDGRGQIHLREELSYVDAYLYIIKERLGERLVVERQIDQTMLDELIPRLILQPIVENAVEHDISSRRGGRIVLRAYREGGRTVLEMEHDGSMSPEDRERIRSLLSDSAGQGSQLGLRNVKERLRLIYGDEGELTIDEVQPGIILARVSFPAA